MSNQDRDWLDERIAVSNYIPDDGFTARVVRSLPKPSAEPALSQRTMILMVSTLLAMALIVLQVGPLIQSINHFVAHTIRGESVVQIAKWIQEPAVLFSGACGLTLLGVAAIPFLRRWV
jgi:hypothetical protein